MLSRAPFRRSGAREATEGSLIVALPRPTLQFRLRAWRDYQRALDPLAPPKPLRPPPLQLG